MLCSCKKNNLFGILQLVYSLCPPVCHTNNGMVQNFPNSRSVRSSVNCFVGRSVHKSSLSSLLNISNEIYSDRFTAIARRSKSKIQTLTHHIETYWMRLKEGDTGCSLNIVFFPKILEYSGLWSSSVFP